jgi:ATP-dependent DNA helicase RecQ
LSGYIEYTEEVDARSRVRFLVLRDELYGLNLDKQLDNLVHALLRNYTGLFSDDVYIDETLLASQTGGTRQDVYEMLSQLARMRFIRYVPQKKTPFIVFSQSREETRFVKIPKSVYEERKTRFESRIKAMIEYAEKDYVCRSRMLLIYFNEPDPKDCGHCDVCLKKNETGLSNFEFNRIRTALVERLAQSPARLSELADPNSSIEREKTVSVIRFLVDRGELSIDGDTLSIERG